MAERSIIDQLDDAVSTVLEKRATAQTVDPSLLELVEIARQLRGLPRNEFKDTLKSQLIGSNTMSSPRMEAEQEAASKFSVYLCIRDAANALEFYKKAFGAEELMRLAQPDGKIGHAELKLGDTVIMLSDEYPDYGALSPQTLGGSPVKLHLYVRNVDGFVAKAVTLGANVLRPVEDHPYGDRAGQIEDPFGYTWIISTHKQDVSVEEMQQQFDEFSRQRADEPSSLSETPPYSREGFRTVTPYLTVEQPAELLEFIKKSFLATELGRTTGSAGGLHAEARIGDSMLMVGGGLGLQQMPAAIHLYVPDIDEAYQRALDAGAKALFEPADQPYGERSGAVQDPFGNRWYIATTFGPLQEIDRDLHTVTLFFHAAGVQRFIDFLSEAFGAEEVMRHQEEAVIRHAKVRLGNSVIEMGEAFGEWQPLHSAIYMYVPDVDQLYERAMKAGCESVLPPTDQPYGDRNAWVKDPFGNTWYLATKIESGI